MTIIQISTITIERDNRRTTIDLMLRTEYLAVEVMLCSICNQEYGSDHQAIGTEFDLKVTAAEPEPKFLSSNPPTMKGFSGSHQPTTIEEFPNALISRVDDAVRTACKVIPVHAMVVDTGAHRAKEDYTFWRNLTIAA